MMYNNRLRNRVGIFAGSFDPVHAGHIAFALHALNACKLDRVVFLPERTPRNKQGITSMHHRLAMLQLAIGEHANFEVTPLLSPQFTVRRTLPELEHMFADAELTLLFGSDVAQSLYRWAHIGRLLEHVSFAIGVRQGDTVATVQQAMQTLQNIHALKVRYTVVTTEHADLASSNIRQTLDHTATNPDVAAYIRTHDLYAKLDRSASPDIVTL